MNSGTPASESLSLSPTLAEDFHAAVRRIITTVTAQIWEIWRDIPRHLADPLAANSRQGGCG